MHIIEDFPQTRFSRSRRWHRRYVRKKNVALTVSHEPVWFTNFHSRKFSAVSLNLLESCLKDIISKMINVHERDFAYQEVASPFSRKSNFISDFSLQDVFTVEVLGELLGGIDPLLETARKSLL